KIGADLVTYGKVIGGGLPVGAFGGRKEIMQHISPVGNVYQAGTLSGNPVTVMAGYTTLNILKNNPEIYQNLENIGNQLSEGIHQALNAKGIPHTLNHIGSMLSLFFGNLKLKDFETASLCDVALFNRFFHHMLKQGFYLPPSAFETWFLNAAISQEDIEKTIHAVNNF
ncbi:MAG: aminotransferase class III-fold pyridoxal phosphate-dependent enzyme, partial [Bacteroidales bacterium]|nr:aminotransferase class III-fold pyridoxal phosphate-dependent enzyme [Bacteroidales bacterium]